jgi:hypothetical protein
MVIRHGDKTERLTWKHPDDVEGVSRGHWRKPVHTPRSSNAGGFLHARARRTHDAREACARRSSAGDCSTPARYR